MKMVKNLTTGAQFIATDRLLKRARKRSDLQVIEVEDERGPAPSTVSPTSGATRKKTSKKSSGKKASNEPGSSQGEGGPSLVEQISNLRGKDAIENLIFEEYGVDLDKRLSLPQLKEQAFDIIAKADAGDGEE